MDGPKGLSSLVISHNPKESRPPVFPRGQRAAQQAREYARYSSPGTRSRANDHVFTVLINSASEKGGANPLLYKNANKEIAKIVSTA